MQTSGPSRARAALVLTLPTQILQDRSIYELDHDLPSPTEPNTPSDGGNETQDSGDHKSFSSLINYDPSSQPAAQASQQQQSSQDTQPRSSLSFTSSAAAETLKLRLQVAMYKVKTNQVHTPFSQLLIPNDKPPQTTNEAVEAAVAELRREAQARLPPLSDMPACGRLLPAPVLLPTVYSSRRLPYEQGPAQVTPVTSPLKSGMSSAGRFARGESADLTSSAVKGRVAEGLLGLSRGM
jgi:hypothetical protein